MITLLIDLFPDAVKTANKGGEYPLHLTFSYHLHIVLRIIDIFPRACREKSKNTGFPLHHACCTENISIEVNNLLLSVYPNACKRVSSSDSTPLYVVCAASNVSLDAICRLVDIYPEATKMSDNGDYPLHIYCRNQTIAYDTFQYFFIIIRTLVNMKMHKATNRHI